LRGRACRAAARAKAPLGRQKDQLLTDIAIYKGNEKNGQMQKDRSIVRAHNRVPRPPLRWPESRAQRSCQRRRECQSLARQVQRSRQELREARISGKRASAEATALPSGPAVLRW